MTNRYLVIQPDSITTPSTVSDDLLEVLSQRGSVTTVDALHGSDIDQLVDEPDQAMAHIIDSIIRIDTDSAIILPANFSALPTVSEFDWAMSVAASIRARIILSLETEGVPPELLLIQLKAAVQRAREHQAVISAIALPPSVANHVSLDGVLSLPTPLTAESLELLDQLPPVEAVTPFAFQTDLINQARVQRKRIVLPEPEDDRVLHAAAQVIERGIADIIFIGDESKVHTRADELNIDLSQATVISADNSEFLEKYAAEFARLRAKKGITLEQARTKIREDVSYFGTMMVQMGDADGMVSGAAHTTANTIVPAFQIIKTAPNVAIVSSVFLMLMKDRIWVFGDCAVNTNPTPEQLADIAISSAKTAQQFNVEPRVAMLSYSTSGSGAGPDVDAVIEATRIAQQKAPDLLIDGPIQFDAAVDESVARIKAPDSPVAGRATVFIFPSLTTGNICYKAVQRTSGAVAVGPVLQGLNKPVNDLSRGALIEDIVNTIALTAIQAQG